MEHCVNSFSSKASMDVYSEFIPGARTLEELALGVSIYVQCTVCSSLFSHSMVYHNSKQPP